MAARGDSHGYIAIARSIFDHPEFKESRAFTRLEAWQWMIGQCAFRPMTKRFKHESVRLDRGQLTDSVRAIAKAWRWPKSNVHRWLRRLVELEMIALARTGTASGTVTGTARIILTICNYDRYNRTRKKVGQQPGQQPGQPSAQMLLLEEKIPLEPTNHITIESLGGEGHHPLWKPLKTRTVQIQKPGHGAKGKGVIWFDYATPDWKMYAEDFKEVRGVDILPENRPGGRGNWFRTAGERSGRKRT